MTRRVCYRIIMAIALAMPVLVAAQPASPTTTASENDARSLLSAFESYTDLRIASVQRSLELLTGTAEVRVGTWAGMQELLKRYQRADAGLAVWYVVPDGTYYTAEKGLSDERLSDREYFPDLMAGKVITGALVVSRSTGQRSAVIAVPIIEAGRVVGAVGASLFLDRLSEQVGAALDLRAGVAYFAMAPNGLTTLHSRTDRHFLDPRELGSETLRRAANEMLSGTSGIATYVFDDVTKTAIYRTSQLTQWRFALTFNAIPIK